MSRLHQNNFSSNVTSNQIAGVTTTPLNSIPSIAAPFYIALDATNINGKYEVVDVTSKTATNILHAATTYAHTTAEEVRLVVPAVELDAFSVAADSSFSSFTNPYKFRVSRVAAANTGNNAYATIAFDTEQYDTGNNVSSGVFTVPVTGYYQFNWFAYFVTSGVQDSIIALFYDGGIYSKACQWNISSNYASGSGSDLIYCVAGKTVDIRVYCNTARALNVGSENCYFSGFLVSTT